MLCYYIRIDYAFFTSGSHHAQTSLAHGAARERRGPVGAPSILLETSFISNARDNQLLLTAPHQQA
jgi:hypothetical protein